MNSCYERLHRSLRGKISGTDICICRGYFRAPEGNGGKLLPEIEITKYAEPELKLQNTPSLPGRTA